jgi:hypothetical protein
VEGRIDAVREETRNQESNIYYAMITQRCKDTLYSCSLMPASRKPVVEGRIDAVREETGNQESNTRHVMITQLYDLN